MGAYDMTQKTMQDLINGVYPGLAMLAGMQLDVFTPLNNQPMTTEELAQALDVGPMKLRPLLDNLVVAGLLTQDEGRYANTAEAGQFLVRGQPNYMGAMHGQLARFWSGILKTAASIRTGMAQDKVDFANLTPEAAETFFRQLHPGNVATGHELAKRFDLSSATSLLDVGGGSGGLAIGITEELPNIRATVVDLPNVTPLTSRFVAEARHTARISVMAADVVHEPLTGSYDVAALRAFMQVLSPEQAQAALRNIAQVLEPGGSIYIIGNQILDDTRLSPLPAVQFNLYLVNALDDGRGYTESEHREWLIAAGFTDITRVVLPDGWSIISARKPNNA
jgi:SAM-dependent methyltransferase